MILTSYDISRMIDISAVQADSTQNDIKAMIVCAKKYECIAVFTLPCQASFTKELLQDCPKTNLGGVVGFPGGGHTTYTKTMETRELVDKIKCDEIDMVINVGMLRSGQYDYVGKDIREVVKAANGKMVKVILECHYLTESEIKKGCELSLNAGASFVKSGTGWAPTGATKENISLMKACVGNKAKVKAAGGVRDLDTLIELYKCGARRFGIGTDSAINILEQCKKLPNGEIEL